MSASGNRVAKRLTLLWTASPDFNTWLSGTQVERELQCGSIREIHSPAGFVKLQQEAGHSSAAQATSDFREKSEASFESAL